MTAKTTTFPINTSRVENVSSGWSSLYKLGGISALLSVAIVIIQLIVFTIAPPPWTELPLTGSSFFKRTQSLH